MKRLALVLLLAVVYFVLAAFADPLVLRFCVLIGSFVIGLPCLIGFGFSAFSDRAGHRSASASRQAFVYAAAIIALCWLTLPANALVLHHAELAAKAYPEKIRAQLEAYRTGHGVYPPSLDALLDKPRVPRLLRSGEGYYSDGRTYIFRFTEPGERFRYWQYDGRLHSWFFFT